MNLKVTGADYMEGSICQPLRQDDSRNRPSSRFNYPFSLLISHCSTIETGLFKERKSNLLV